MVKFKHTHAYLLKQLHKRRWSVSLRFFWKRPDRPRRTRVSRWVCWRYSPARHNQHRQNRWQTRHNLQKTHAMKYYMFKELRTVARRQTLIDVTCCLGDAPSAWISWETWRTSSWERPSVSTTRTLGTPLLAPPTAVNTESLTCCMALPAEVRGHTHSWASLQCVYSRAEGVWVFVFACLCVSSFIWDPLNGVQQALFIIVGAELELGASVITELSDGHLRHTHTHSDIMRL